MVSPASGARVPDRPGQGLYLLEPVGPEVLARARTVDARYADANLGLVDSSVIAVAERLNADAIATLNHDDLRLASQGCWPLLPPP